MSCRPKSRIIWEDGKVVWNYCYIFSNSNLLDETASTFWITQKFGYQSKYQKLQIFFVRNPSYFTYTYILIMYFWGKKNIFLLSFLKESIFPFSIIFRKRFLQIELFSENSSSSTWGIHLKHKTSPTSSRFSVMIFVDSKFNILQYKSILHMFSWNELVIRYRKNKKFQEIRKSELFNWKWLSKIWEIFAQFIESKCFVCVVKLFTNNSKILYSGFQSDFLLHLYLLFWSFQLG